MGEHVTLEVGLAGNWAMLPTSIGPTDRPGCLPHHPRHGDQRLYMFGWFDGEGPCVWEAQPGYRATETDIDRAVIVELAGVNKVADLTEGPVMIPIIDEHGDPSIARFTYHAGD